MSPSAPSLRTERSADSTSSPSSQGSWWRTKRCISRRETSSISSSRPWSRSACRSRISTVRGSAVSPFSIRRESEYANPLMLVSGVFSSCAARLRKRSLRASRSAAASTAPARSSRGSSGFSATGVWGAKRSTKAPTVALPIRSGMLTARPAPSLRRSDELVCKVRAARSAAGTPPSCPNSTGPPGPRPKTAARCAWPALRWSRPPARRRRAAWRLPRRARPAPGVAARASGGRWGNATSCAKGRGRRARRREGRRARSRPAPGATGAPPQSARLDRWRGRGSAVRGGGRRRAARVPSERRAGSSAPARASHFENPSQSGQAGRPRGVGKMPGIRVG